MLPIDLDIKERILQMNTFNFWETLAIASVPSIITSILSFFASWISAKNKMQNIKEQNNADLKKLNEHYKRELEFLKEQYKMRLDLEEQAHKREKELLVLNKQMEERGNMENAIGNIILSVIDKIVDNIKENKNILSEEEHGLDNNEDDETE